MNKTTSHINDLTVNLPTNVFLNEVYANNIITNLFRFQNQDQPDIYIYKNIDVEECRSHKNNIKYVYQVYYK